MSLLLPHPDCCGVRVLVVGVLVFPFCLDCGGMNVLSIDGKRSSIDQNQTLTEHKTMTHPHCDCAPSSVVRPLPGMLLLLDQI